MAKPLREIICWKLSPVTRRRVRMQNNPSYEKKRFIRRLLQGISLHTQREDGANTSRLRPLQRNRRSHNDAIKNTKVKVRSSDGETDYFDIVAGVLQEHTLAPYLFIICLDCVLKTSIDLMKENGLRLTKEEKAEHTPHKLLRTRTTTMT